MQLLTPVTRGLLFRVCRRLGGSFSALSLGPGRLGRTPCLAFEALTLLASALLRVAAHVVLRQLLAILLFFHASAVFSFHALVLSKSSFSWRAWLSSTSRLT